MPGKPGFNLPGIPQHVVQRGNNRSSLQVYRHAFGKAAIVTA